MLRQSMQLGRMSIDGIRPPPHEVVITTTTSQATPATVHRPQIAAQPTAIVRPALVGLVLIAFCVCCNCLLSANDCRTLFGVVVVGFFFFFWGWGGSEQF